MHLLATMRLVIATGLSAFLLALNCDGAVAQGWPTRQIQVVSPFFPGTTFDLVARLILDQASREVGQSIALQNRPGNGGLTGVTSVAKAANDGYTLLLSTSAMVTATILHKNLPYNMLQDFEPVALFGGEPSALIAAPDREYSSVDDLVAAAKANPGKLKYASIGIASPGHLAAERFRLVAGINVQHKMYASPVEAFNDLIAGRVDFYFVPIPPALPLAAKGKVVFLAVSTIGPWPLLPDIPTLAQYGYPTNTFLTWCGLAAPARTPRAIVDKLNKAIVDAMAIPAIRNRLERMGFKTTSFDPDQYGQFLADETTAIGKLAKSSGIEAKD